VACNRYCRRWARWPSHSRNPRFLEVQCLTIAGNQSDGGQGGGLDGSANGARPRRGGHQIVGCLLHLLTAAYGTKRARAYATDARSDLPHLATALLGHHDPRVTYEHYNRATSLNAAMTYAALIQQHYSS
jgi:hypothetical protein